MQRKQPLDLLPYRRRRCLRFSANIVRQPAQKIIEVAVRVLDCYLLGPGRENELTSPGAKLYRRSEEAGEIAIVASGRMRKANRHRCDVGAGHVPHDTNCRRRQEFDLVPVWRASRHGTRPSYTKSLRCRREMLG